MKLRLDYGTTGLDANVPDERVTVIEPIHRAAAADPHGMLLTAIRSPMGCRPLREIARPGQRVAISVCDITRAQPRRAMLLALFEELPGIADRDVTILIATGTHRTNREDELERMLGRDILNRWRVVNHDSRNASTLESVGRTSTGVPMSAAATIVKPGGTIVCAAECRDGLPNHGSYGAVLASQPSPQALLDMITAPGYSQPDQWQVQIQAQIQLKARVLVKAEGLGHDALRAAHFTPTDDVSDAVCEALGAAGPASMLCVLPQGPQTIPYLA